MTLLARHREDPKIGFPIDVLNLSLSYYHETPIDGLFSLTLYQLLAKARELGCVVVCSAGNDAIDRPSFPASLWSWPGADNGIRRGQRRAARVGRSAEPLGAVGRPLLEHRPVGSGLRAGSRRR